MYDEEKETYSFDVMKKLSDEYYKFSFASSLEYLRDVLRRDCPCFVTLNDIRSHMDTDKIRSELEFCYGVENNPDMEEDFIKIREYKTKFKITVFHVKDLRYYYSLH